MRPMRRSFVIIGTFRELNLTSSYKAHNLIIFCSVRSSRLYISTNKSPNYHKENNAKKPDEELSPIVHRRDSASHTHTGFGKDRYHYDRVSLSFFYLTNSFIDIIYWVKKSLAFIRVELLTSVFQF